MANKDVEDLLSSIPGADENTVESTVRPPSKQSVSKPAPLDPDEGEVDDESVGDLLPEDLQAPAIPNSGDRILIHFVEDGFSVLEQLWYRGQELEIILGSTHWNATLDREGNSWMLLTEEDQIRKYGKVFFRPGAWPHADFEDSRAAERERKRARRPSHPSPGSLIPGGRG